MYESHWNFSRKPFDNDFDLSLFYESKDHREALNRILFAVRERKSLVLVSGDHGLGKSLVARMALTRLQGQGGSAALIGNPAHEPLAFLRQVNHAFGLECSEQPRFRLLDGLRDFCMGLAGAGARATLLVDNADTIEEPAIFAELRKLLDLTDDDGRSLLTIVLVASPGLRRLLARQNGLAQRLDVAARLNPLDAGETKAYLLHRLRVVDAPRHQFDNAAIDELHRASGGVPRVLNRIADFALLIGKMQDRTKVTTELVTEAVEEVRQLALISRGVMPPAAEEIEADVPSLTAARGATEVEEAPRRERRGRGRDRDRDEDDSKRGRRGRRGRGRDRDDDRDRDEDRDDDKRGRRGRRGRGRDRDEDRDDDNKRGRRGRRGRGRDRDEDRDDDNKGGRRGRKGRGRDRDEDGGDDSGEALAFNRKDHMDIPSMDDLIQNDLKVVNVPARGRRAPVKKERDDVVQYFDAALGGSKSSSDDQDDKGDKGDKRGRGRRGRGGRDRRERGDRGDRGERDDKGEKRSRRSDSRKERAPVPTKPRPKPADAGMNDEELTEFGDGLVKVDPEVRKKQLAEQQAQAEKLDKARAERERRAAEAARKAEEARKLRDAEDDGFGVGLGVEGDSAKAKDEAKPKKKPATRKRAAKKKDDDGDSDAGAEDKPKKKPATRKRTKKKDEDGDAEAEEAEDKPKKKRTRRKTAKSDEEGSPESTESTVGVDADGS